VAPVQSPIPPTARTVRPGTDVTLTAASTNGIPPPAYHWLFNGKPIDGGTGRVLVLRNVQHQQAGTYSVIVSNFASFIIETNAVVQVPGPLRLFSEGFDSDGYYRLSVDGVVDPGFVLQTATNIDAMGYVWIPLLTNPITRQPFLFLDTNVSRYRQRFYRALDSR